MFNSPPKYVLTVAIVIATIRLMAFWILTITEWTHNQSWSLVPLVLLLWPEAWLLAADAKLTGWFAIGFSVVLCVPIGLAAILEIWITRWREKKRLSRHDL